MDRAYATSGKSAGLLPASFRVSAILSSVLTLLLINAAPAWSAVGDALSKQASWQPYDATKMSGMLRSSLDELGVLPDEMDKLVDEFLAAIEKEDSDPLDAYVAVTRKLAPVVDQLVTQASRSALTAGSTIDPNSPAYGELESLPKSLRMTVRTWLGRELVRGRFFDEALPAIAEVDPLESIDPAATLFYRGTCYHALLMKDEALADLRRLLENEDQCPVRYSRTAQLMVADIKPLKEDSLDEISRIMSDVTRRLDLGRTDQDVQKQEQRIIDKLDKLIEQIEQQQQQQQQQQQAASGQGGGNQGGQSSPMDDSRIAGGGGSGDVDRKKIEQRDGWGNLPPAERQQAIQQISRDLPTHYREAIEAYFRKLATDNN